MDISLSKLQELMMDREGWCAVIHGVTKKWTWLSDWTELNCIFTIYLWHAQSYLTVCDNMDGSPPGSSVYGNSQEECWSRLPFPSPGDLLDPRIEPASPATPALIVCFFTTWATRKPISTILPPSLCSHLPFFSSLSPPHLPPPSSSPCPSLFSLSFSLAQYFCLFVLASTWHSSIVF